MQRKLATIRRNMALGAMFATTLLAAPAAATTRLYLDSEVGDWIGRGLEQTFTDEDGTFSAAKGWNDDGVEIRFYSEEDSWQLEFHPPEGDQLIPGPYEMATRSPFQSPARPGLDISGNYRGCNELFGRFDVLEAQFGIDGEVLSFAADFEQHCEYVTPALRGTVMYQADGPPFAPPPDSDDDGVFDVVDNCPFVGNTGQADDDLDGIGNKCDDTKLYTSFSFTSEQGDYVGQGRQYSVTPIGAVFTAKRNAVNGISIFIDDGNNWHVDFAAPRAMPLFVGPYENAVRYPFQSPTNPGLDVYGDGRGCNVVEGSFHILELEYGPTQYIEHLAATFEQHCEGWEPALTGTVMINSKGPPFAPPPDYDHDGVLDVFDNCLFVSNPDQANDDHDEFGAVCDPDGFTVETIELLSEPGDWVGAGQTLLLEPGVGSMTLLSSNPHFASFQFLGADFWNFDFLAPGDRTLEPGAFEDAWRYPFQGYHPGMSVSGQARGCNSLSGRFDVLEATFDDAAALQTFAVDFEQHCEGMTPALYGKLRWHTKPPCECADPDASGGLPGATDCRTVLTKAVGLAVACPAECCNVDSKGSVSAGDALRCLQCAVGTRECTCEPD